MACSSKEVAGSMVMVGCEPGRSKDLSLLAGELLMLLLMLFVLAFLSFEEVVVSSSKYPRFKAEEEGEEEYLNDFFDLLLPVWFILFVCNERELKCP